MEKLGVIGGMGPEATSYYYDQVVRHTLAGSDQDHIDSIIYDDVKAGRDPDLAKFGRVLDWFEAAGCDRVILACTELSVHKALALVAVIALAMAAGQAPATAWAEGAIEAQVEIIGTVALSEGDEVTWCYSADDEGLPAEDDIVSTPRPRAPTRRRRGPASHAAARAPSSRGFPRPPSRPSPDWSFDYRLGEQFGTTTDPVIVGDSIYVVSSGKLMRVSTETGELLASAPVGELGYFCRIAYADGLVIVPSETGSLTAYTADTLTAVWRSAALAKPVVGGGEYSYQALSSLTVSGGRVWAAFTDPGLAGAMVCVDVEDGSLAWSRVTTKDDTGDAEGYYWAGAAVSDGGFVVPSESGRIELVDSADGTVISPPSSSAPRCARAWSPPAPRTGSRSSSWCRRTARSTSCAARAALWWTRGASRSQRSRPPRPRSPAAASSSAARPLTTRACSPSSILRP